MYQLETLLIVLHENQWEDSLFQGSPELFSPSAKRRALRSRLGLTKVDSLTYQYSRNTQHITLHTAGAPEFELTNLDSAGGKSFTVLTSMKVNRNRIEIRPFISLEIALNIQEKGLAIFKIISDCKKWKIWNILCLQACNLASNGSPVSGMATRS